MLTVGRAQAVCDAFMQVYGQEFVHGGDHRRSAPPPYLDPFDLLDAPTVDPTVPARCTKIGWVLVTSLYHMILEFTSSSINKSVLTSMSKGVTACLATFHCAFHQN